jgi:N-acyl-D-aspartate/D-glutamate deacylase
MPQPREHAYDLMVRGGRVVDGTGSPAVRADVGIREGRIAAVGSDLDAGAAEVVDATRCIVTPGFVDVHTHYDGQARRPPIAGESAWLGHHPGLGLTVWVLAGSQLKRPLFGLVTFLS